MITRSSLITSSFVAMSLMLAIPTASATTILRPLVRPGTSSSSSSTSSAMSVASSSASSAMLTLNSSSSQSSTSSASSSTALKALKLNPSNGNKLAEYCKAVSQLYTKGTTLTPDSVNADKFNHLMDVLAKGNALCGAMEFAVSSSSSSVSSSWWSSSSSSQASWGGIKQPNYNACKNLGTEKTVGGVKFCKFMCGLNTKVEPCPKS